MPFTNWVTLVLPGNRRVSTNKLRLSLASAKGTFSGTVVAAGSTKTNIIRGALFQNLSCGYGYMLGTNQSGEVFLEPQ